MVKKIPEIKNNQELYKILGRFMDEVEYLKFYEKP